MDFQALLVLQKPEQNRIHGSVPALLSIIFSFHVCSDLCSEPVSCVGNKFAPPVRVKYLFHNRPYRSGTNAGIPSSPSPSSSSTSISKTS